uniref:Uncharacterized protein n=1 Tax=Arundo donax TaxID=35708 RepID=A0A0A9E1M4_ARUDO
MMQMSVSRRISLLLIKSLNWSDLPYYSTHHFSFSLVNLASEINEMLSWTCLIRL